METEVIKCRCKIISLQEEEADQIVHVAMADHYPELKQCKEGLADCLAQHNEKIILQRKNENEMELLRGLLIDVRNNQY